MLLVTCELLVILVAPLLVLYLTGPWPLRVSIPCLIVIPALWYLTYAPIHELSHVLGAYVAGGSVTGVRLIPSFWRGEFGRAWITHEGLRAPWQQFVMTSAPYVLDGLSVAGGLLASRRSRLRGALASGLVLMFLCLRPAFDVVCESIAFASGSRGDLYHLALAIGAPFVWASAILLSAFSFFTIVRGLAPGASSVPGPSAP